MLLKQGICLAPKDKNSYNQLCCAFASDDKKETLRLLHNNVNLETRERAILLSFVARHKSLDWLEIFIQNGFETVLKQNCSSIIIFAVTQKNHALLKFLIEKGVDFSTSASPLIHAIQYNDFESVKLLVENNAKCSKDIGHYIAKNYNIDILELLIDKLKDLDFESLTLKGIRNDNNELLEVLIKKDLINIDKRLGDEQNTLLHIAVNRNSFRTVELLINYDADIEAKNSDGYSPFDNANLNRLPINVSRLLLEKKANNQKKKENNKAVLRKRTLFSAMTKPCEVSQNKKASIPNSFISNGILSKKIEIRKQSKSKTL